MKLEQEVYSVGQKIDFDAHEVERKKHFVKDEIKGIKEYKEAISESKGRERKVYENILPQEKRHLKEIESI